MKVIQAANKPEKDSRLPDKPDCDIPEYSQVFPTRSWVFPKIEIRRLSETKIE